MLSTAERHNKHIAGRIPVQGDERLISGAQDSHLNKGQFLFVFFFNV